MTSNDAARQAAEDAAAVLAPEFGQLASVDSAGLGEATLNVLMRAAGRPADLAAATVRFWTSMARIAAVAAGRSGGPARVRGRRARACCWQLLEVAFSRRMCCPRPCSASAWAPLPSWSWVRPT